ncbi:MAG: hypothetical protein ACR2JE_10625 [Acidobacteriaceae bacterium]
MPNSSNRSDTSNTPGIRYDPEPRWPAILALLAVGGLHLALPDALTVGPSWLLIVAVAVLMVPTVIARHRGYFTASQIIGYAVLILVTVALVWSLWRLIAALPGHVEAPRDLLRSATVLWVSNILVFASWYWRLDAGGPYARERRDTHKDGAFLFPQMTIPAAKLPEGQRRWSPEFVDYLFLAFNTSTAFSPTDVPILSRWAKLLMMTQSTISFATVALLAARAVNIL